MIPVVLFCKKCISYWRSTTIILSPILLSPLITTGQTEYRAAYCLFLMAIYWMTEVIPLAVTALLPIVLYPLLGVMTSDLVCREYFKKTNVLFIGGLIVALAVEESQLHKRVALRMLLLMGSDPKWLMLGFMLTTALLSMWISNTATTAMMVPVASAVIEEILAEAVKKTNKEAKTDANTTLEDYFELAQPRDRKIAKTLLLSVCYAANVGGTGALTGTGPNIVFMGQLNSIYPNQDVMTFASWMMMALPLTMIILFAAWICLMIFGGMLSCSSSSVTTGDQVKKTLADHYKQLGPLRFEEMAVTFWFALLVLLWIFRDPKFIPGWGSLFLPKFVGDETSSICMALVVMIFPRSLPSIQPLITLTPQRVLRIFGIRKPQLANPQDTIVGTGYSPLVSWQTVQRKLMWDIVILLGGGFALAKGIQTSGLSELVSSQLKGLSNIPTWAFITIAITTMTFMTEITSNVATATIIIPLMQAVSVDLQLNPIMLMFPVAIAASFAFMLPVATAPNAIVFGTGIVQVKDMAFVGMIMNIICIIVTSLYMNSYVELVFGLSEVPDWARNVTQIGIKNGSMLLNKTILLLSSSLARAPN